MRAAVGGLALLVSSTASYHCPHGFHSWPPAVHHRRAAAPSLGFFDEMKKGFNAGMATSQSLPQPEGSVEQQAKESQSNNMLSQFLSAVLPSPKTEEEWIAERIRKGEGVVWSADFSRVWMATKGPPG